MINILLLAPPAAGKGTQSEILENKFNITHVSTGNLLREASDRDSVLKEILKSGKLVSDEIVLDLLSTKLNQLTTNGFLLDGFPRNINQALELDKILLNLGLKLDYVFFLDVPKDVLKRRVTGRRLCKKCNKIYNIYSFNGITCTCGGELYQRDDDTEDAFELRYQTYLDSTLPLVKFYEKQGILHRIDASLEIDRVNEIITSIIERDVSND